MTRKEAGLIAEILTLASLQEGKNVLVDGSLRDATWYKLYFQKLREKFQNLRIAILHVTAPPKAILERAENRSKSTGRIVPQETLKVAMEEVPKSVKILRPLSDYFCELHNAPDRDITIRTNGISWESFRSNWAQSCPTDHENKRIHEDALQFIGFESRKVFGKQEHNTLKNINFQSKV